MKKKNYLFLAMAAIAFTACSSDDDLAGTTTSSNELVAAQVSAGVSSTATRADGAKWEADEIGVIVTNSTVTGSTTPDLYKNVKYTTESQSNDAATFTSTDGIYFQDADETLTFAAYGPYQSTDDIATLPGSEGVISNVSTSSQSTRDAQKAMDFIFASGAKASKEKPYVVFNGTSTVTGDGSTAYVQTGTSFSHVMSKLIIKIVASDGLTYSNLTDGTTTFTLSGLYHSGTFNVTSGEAAATTGDATSDWSLTEKSLKTENASTDVTFTSILYPHDYSGSALTFTATIGGQTYTNSDGITPNLEAGHSYLYTVTISQQGIKTVVSSGTADWDGWAVTDWTEGNGEGTAVDAEMSTSE